MFQNFSRSHLGRRLSRGLLTFDSWVDSSLFSAGEKTRAAYAAFSARMDRLHVSGFARFGVEAACEGLTLGLAGAILALALAIPAFRETSDENWLKKQDLAVTFLDRTGEQVGQRGIRHDDSVPLEQFPDYVIQAVLATEDRRFFEHWGIDPVGTMRALTVNARGGGVVQGGSTLTQQLAKNLFLTNERSIERKIKEAFLALWLEQHLQKREILKLYLDRAYMGGGTFGIQAASEFYFNKSVRDLSLAEGAMLAGLFKAPTKYAPHINLPAARARANDVLKNMVNAGMLTEGQIYAARRNPARPVDRKRDLSPDWYLDWAYDEVVKLSAAGKLGNDRVLIVRTGLDLGIQKKADTAIEDALRLYGKQFRAKQGATVVMEPTGLVRAIVGGRDYGASQFNRATDAVRQPGSSYKPIVYLSALMTGKVKATSIVDGSGICLGNWCPQNYGGASAGHLPLVTALQKSLNTVAVRLSVIIGQAYWTGKDANQWNFAKLGRAKILENSRKMGITTPLTDTVSLPLGAGDVKMIDMAAVYSVFANGGRRAPPFAAVEIRNSKGDLIYRRDRDGPPLEQVIPADKIAEMNNMMKEVVSGGTARAAMLEGVTAAGKTGTTNAYRDAWFDGFTGNYVCTVWFGNDDSTSMNNMTGGSLPARTWHEIMAYAHKGIELKNPYGVVGPAPAVAARPQAPASAAAVVENATILSRGSLAVLISIETLFDTARRTILPRPGASAASAVVRAAAAE